MPFGWFRGFILRDATLRVAPQDEVLDPHGEERGNAARLEPWGPLWDTEAPEACYNQQMPKRKQPATKKAGFVIGRAGFAKISAVDGIRLTSAMKKRAVEAERKGASAKEFRQAIVRSHRKVWSLSAADFCHTIWAIFLKSWTLIAPRSLRDFEPGSSNRLVTTA
jgi:hypothetical protein